MERNRSINRWGYIIILICIPLVVLLGTLLLGGKQYAFITTAVTAFACVPFIFAFEQGNHSTAEAVIISVFIALSALGRVMFFALPGFKPVTAFTIMAGMYFGAEAGFMTGALSAVLSNIYFRQGPWTPFQMLSWGLIGFFAGMLSNQLKRSRIVLIIYGVFSGVFFSLVMDTWSTLWADGYFNLTRYIPLVISSLPVMTIYAMSNIIFLLALKGTIGKQVERLRQKYGI